MKQLLPLALACAALPVYAQSPQPTPSPVQPGVQAPPVVVNSRSASESSRVSRLVSGPDGRPQGLLLRNGTFVTLSPGLAQQIPATVRRNTTVHVRGFEYYTNSGKTLQAQNLMIAEVSYKDAAGAPGVTGLPGIAPAGMPSPPPPPPGAPRGRGVVPPPPPAPPAGVGAVGTVPPPPPPPSGSGATPLPPVPNGPAPIAPSVAAPATPPPAGGAAPVPAPPQLATPAANPQ